MVTGVLEVYSADGVFDIPADSEIAASVVEEWISYSNGEDYKYNTVSPEEFDETEWMLLDYSKITAIKYIPAPRED